jgi:glutathione S-transferase
LRARSTRASSKSSWRASRCTSSAKNGAPHAPDSAQADLANATRKIEVAVDKIEKQLTATPWIAGDLYTLADINLFAMAGLAVARMFPEMNVDKRAPRFTAWVQRVSERPGVKAALAMPNRTNPALRTFTGEAR